MHPDGDGYRLVLVIGEYSQRRENTTITWTNALRIRQGMDLDQVEKILGGPPRIERVSISAKDQ
jgi:hypothetical protein